MKILKLLTVFSGVLFLAACSNTNDPSNPESEPDTSESEEPVDPKIEAYGYEPHFTETMPDIRITTTDGSNDFATKYDLDDKRANKIDYVDCLVSTTNCEEEYTFTDKVCEIKVRGNYTLQYEKKPLRLKFDKKQSLFGLNDDAECKSWVLLADYKDRSMLNNATSFFLGNTILESEGYYSSDFKHVNVYLNNQYWGVYLLVEQQQTNKHRVDILEPEDEYAGTDIGYLIEYDGYYTFEDPNNGGDYTFTIDYNNGQVTKYNGGKYTPPMKGFTIKSDITNDAQVTFIKNFVQNTFKIMHEGVYNGKSYVFDETYQYILETSEITPQEAIERVVDTKSLANMYLLQEIACDNDIDWSSFYMSCSFEPGNFKRLTFEAPWDFDSAYGIKANTCNDAQGLYVANHVNPWMNILINETWFQGYVKSKWLELIDYDVLYRSLDYIELVIDKYANYFALEYERWGANRLYNGELITQVNNMKTHKEAGEYLYNWLKTRYESIHSYWGDERVLFPDYEEIEGYQMYRVEAEDATLSGPVTAKEDTSNYNASGGGYLGNVNGSSNPSEITFNLTSAGEQNVKFHLGLAKRNKTISINSLFEFYLDNTLIKFEDKNIKTSQTDHWHEWYSQYLGEIALPEGEFEFTIKTTGISDTTNLDYIEFYANYEIGLAS